MRAGLGNVYPYAEHTSHILIHVSRRPPSWRANSIFLRAALSVRSLPGWPASTSTWTRCNMVGPCDSEITSCDTGSCSWGMYLHNTLTCDKKNWDKIIGDLGKLDSSPNSKAYLILLQKSHCLCAWVNSWGLRFWTTGICSVTAPTGTLRYKTFARHCSGSSQ